MLKYKIFKEGTQMHKENSKRKITLTLDDKTLDLMGELVEKHGYGSISAVIRVLVNKYARKEINGE